MIHGKFHSIGHCDPDELCVLFVVSEQPTYHAKAIGKIREGKGVEVHS